MTEKLFTAKEKKKFHYCLYYQKLREARWLSHLDLGRTLSQALRRSQLPIVYSQGYNPHPKLSYSPALPVGVASITEMLELSLTKKLKPEKIINSLNQQLPPSLKALKIELLGDGKSKIANLKRSFYLIKIDLPKQEQQSLLEKFFSPASGRQNKSELTDILKNWQVEIRHSGKNNIWLDFCTPINLKYAKIIEVFRQLADKSFSGWKIWRLKLE